MFDEGLSLKVLKTLTVLCVVSSLESCAGASHLRLDRNPTMEEPWLTGLPPLGAEHAPDSPRWDNSIAICAVMKDEALEDVVEWLSYYEWLGVDHVFLTDNGSRDATNLLSALRQRFHPAFLTTRFEAMPRAQLKVYAWCAEEQRASFSWLAFFDLDEYLVLRDSATGVEPDLKGFLDAYKDTAGLSVHWVWVGPSGHWARPRGGGVLQHYTRCVSRPDKHVKTIANTYFLHGVDVHPHNFLFRAGSMSVTEAYEAVSNQWKAKPSCKQGPASFTDGHCLRPAQAQKRAQCCFQTPGAVSRRPSIERIALFHYATKSWQDFEAKMLRGSGMSLARKGMAYFQEITSGQEDAPLCKEPAGLYERCCSAAGHPADAGEYAVPVALAQSPGAEAWSGSLELVYKQVFRQPRVPANGPT